LSSSPNAWTITWTARSPVLVAVLIAVAAGTGLAGCGRKGGLDPPPLTAPPAPPPTDQQGMLMQPGSTPQYALSGTAGFRVSVPPAAGITRLVPSKPT
jgi:hypothetical protein